MNFFGHAVVAGWAGASAPGVLGSMLPDFETMLRVRVVRVTAPEIQDGVDLHHQTDQVFHRTPAFRSLCSEALTGLTAHGVRRGTARAVAHIGTELFLDGYLAAELEHARIYESALDPRLGTTLEWADDGEAFARLHQRLVRWGAPHDYRQPSFVFDRLRDALRARPRLAVIDEQARSLAEFLPTLQSSVEQRAPELLQELEEALGLGR